MRSFIRKLKFSIYVSLESPQQLIIELIKRLLLTVVRAFLLHKKLDNKIVKRRVIKATDEINAQVGQSRTADFTISKIMLLLMNATFIRVVKMEGEIWIVDLVALFIRERLFMSRFSLMISKILGKLGVEDLYASETRNFIQKMESKSSNAIYERSIRTNFDCDFNTVPASAYFEEARFSTFKINSS
jgi:hypothetical protein